jgi:hypothetical protein
MQCYTLRRNERQRNARIYEPGHPMHASSEWESMSLRVEYHPQPGQTEADRCWWLVGTLEADLSDYQLLDPKELGRNNDQE